MERLVNVLGRLPGSRAEKLAFLAENMDLLEAEAEKLFDPDTEARRFLAALKSLAFRFYRAHRGRRHPAAAPHRRDMPPGDRLPLRLVLPALKGAIAKEEAEE